MQASCRLSGGSYASSEAVQSGRRNSALSERSSSLGLEETDLSTPRARPPQVAVTVSPPEWVAQSKLGCQRKTTLTAYELTVVPSFKICQGSCLVQDPQSVSKDAGDMLFDGQTLNLKGRTPGEVVACLQQG